MVVTLGRQYNVGEKPTVILYTYINRHAGTPDKHKTQKQCSTSSNMVVVVIYCNIGCKDKATTLYLNGFLKKNQSALRPSEHPPVRGENVKTFRWDQRLQIQNLFMVFKQVLPDADNIGSTV